ncbi:MAG: hypothetical protein ABIR79_12480 [Candidatus Binatia bacterium]
MPTKGVEAIRVQYLRSPPSQPLSSALDKTFFCSSGSATVTHTFEGVAVRPDDVVFAVVPYPDDTWRDDF